MDECEALGQGDASADGDTGAAPHRHPVAGAPYSCTCKHSSYTAYGASHLKLNRELKEELSRDLKSARVGPVRRENLEYTWLQRTFRSFTVNLLAVGRA